MEDPTRSGDYLGLKKTRIDGQPRGVRRAPVVMSAGVGWKHGVTLLSPGNYNDTLG